MASNQSDDDFEDDFEAGEPAIIDEVTDGDGDPILTAQQIKANNLELRRKIEDRLERKRLREEFGIEDDDWLD